MMNSALRRLQASELSLGILLKQARTTEIAVAMKTAGYDWLFLDLEHNAMSIETVSNLSVAALGVGIAPLVRVPEGQFWMATRALDNGALGIVMPHIDTAAQAREVIDHLRYPPLGRRSMSSVQVHTGFQSLPVRQIAETVERHTLLAVMLETAEAIRNIEEIASIPGIDILMIGASDLCLDLGIPGQVSAPAIVDAFEKLAAACAGNAKWAGMGGVHATADVQRYVAMGVTFVLAANDIGLLVAAGRERVAAIRKPSP